MKFDSVAWIKRADEVVKLMNVGRYDSAGEAIQFATSLLTALYGPQSTQLSAFSAGCSGIEKMKPGDGSIPLELCGFACGAIANARAELGAGLVGSLRAEVTGEILADLVGLGKEALAEGGDASKNVAAVLIAASFEDLMRRMGAEFAGVVGRPALQELVTALKDAGVLKGGEIGIAQSFLKFRNDSLHADWAKVSRAQVESCTAFVEAMLVKHFS